MTIIFKPPQGVRILLLIFSKYPKRIWILLLKILQYPYNLYGLVYHFLMYPYRICPTMPIITQTTHMQAQHSRTTLQVPSPHSPLPTFLPRSTNPFTTFVDPPVFETVYSQQQPLR